MSKVHKNQLSIPEPIEYKDIQDKFRKKISDWKKSNWYRSYADIEENVKFKGISDWINGKRNFSIPKMIKICEYCQIPTKHTVKIGDHSFELYTKSEE